MRILLIGDIVGAPGRRIVRHAVAELKRRENLDFIIANGENADGGSGISPAHYRQLINAGVNCITLGEHIYRRKEISSVLERKDNILKPANYPPDAPGRGWTVLPTASGEEIAVISLLGRVYMRPVDCPYRAAERVLKEVPSHVKAIVVDFHAEATGDMQIMGRYLDGRVSAVLGTHTHVATADEQIFPGGTAFQCDVGMTGPHHSILGRRIDRLLETTLTFRPTPFDVAEEDVRLHGAIVDIDSQTGKATAIRRLALHEDELKPK